MSCGRVVDEEGVKKEPARCEIKIKRYVGK